MAFTFRDPFQDLQAELEAMLGNALGGGSPYPPVNVFEDGDTFVARAELPGVDAGSIELTVEENRLVLRGERRVEAAEKDGAFHRRERSGGQFRRVVRLPAPVAQADVKAEYRDGVLTVRIPKAPEAQPRRVAIQSE